MRFSLGLVDNDKTKCSKFFWELKFELRDKIANILRNNLNEVINATANHKLILKREKATKKSNFVQKMGVPTRMCVNPLLNKMWRLQTIQTRGRGNGSVEIVGRSIQGGVQNHPSTSTMENLGT